MTTLTSRDYIIFEINFYTKNECCLFQVFITIFVWDLIVNIIADYSPPKYNLQ